MAKNMSEKDETLRKVIDMCVEKHRHYWQVLDDFVCHSNESNPEKVMFLRGKIQAFDECAEQCKTMLGYSSQMPDEISNQDAKNPFQCQRDELVTMDMHTCDLCGERVPSPVYQVLLAFNGQSKVATEVCADCMNHLKFKPTKTVPMDAYRDYEQWVMAHPKKNRDVK